MRLLTALSLLLIAPCLSAADDAATAIGKPLSSDPISTSSILQLILVLLFVVGLILLAAWFFRRIGQFGVSGNRAIRYLGGIPVGQRERVVLIEVGGTQLLLGVAPGRVEKLHTLETPIEFDSTSSNSPFAQKLADLVNKKESSS